MRARIALLLIPLVLLFLSLWIDISSAFQSVVFSTSQFKRRVGSQVSLPRRNARVALPSMIMPNPTNPLGSDFEEAEDVANRLFRKYKKDNVGAKKEEASKLGKTIMDVVLNKPLGLTLIEVPSFGVYVQAVTEGSAKVAGVKRGDRIVATSSTVGGQMWDKNSLEGVLAAVQSGTLLGKSMRFRIERDAILSSIVGFTYSDEDISRIDLQRAIASVERARLRVQDTATETFELTLPIPGREMRKLLQGEIFNGDMPYGLQLVQFPDEDGGTRVEVFDIQEGGTAAESGLLRKGDRIIATQSSVGDMMWSKRTIAGIQTAIRTRMVEVLQSGPEDMAGYFTTGGAAVGIASKRGGVGGGTMTGAGLNSSTLATSLSILPSQEQWPAIQDIRKSHDRQARLWPPHVALIKPFVRGEAFLDASQVLVDALQEIEPFSIKMRLETFQHHARCVTVWLVPDEKSLPAIEKLQQLCRKVFPQCGETPVFLDFAPHMTLGQFETQKEAKTLMALVQDRFKDFSVPVNHVYLLSRPDKGSQSVQQVRVLLGRKNESLSQAFKEYSDLRRTGADLNNTTTRSVLLERCCFDVAAMGTSKDVEAIETLVKELHVGCVELDSKFLNLLMMALISSNRPDLAVHYFQDLTGIAQGGDTAWDSNPNHTPNAECAVSDLDHTRHGRSPSASVRLVQLNVRCFTTLIKALGRSGNVEGAFGVLEYMVKNAFAPNIRTINTLLEACIRNGKLDKAQQLFASLKGERGEGFVQFLTPESDEGVAIAVKPTEVSFNIMVNGYARQKQPDTAFKMLLEMRKARCRPDRITYTTLVKACVTAGQMERAVSLIESMRELEIPPDRFCYNIILKGLASRKQWQKAFDVLDDMEVKDKVQPDLFSYSYVISACVRARKVKNAERAMQRMINMGIVPNVNVYSTMMAGYGSAGKFYEAQTLLQEMQERRIKPNEFTFTSLAEAYTNAGMYNEAMQVYSKMVSGGKSYDIVVQTLLVRIYAQQGDFENAFKTLEDIKNMPKETQKGRNTNLAIPYNAIIQGAIQAGNRDMGIQALKAMIADGTDPNRNTYNFLAEERMLSGYQRLDFFLSVVQIVRDAGYTPMGPLYIELLASAIKADDTQTAAVQVKDRFEKKYAVSSVDKEEARSLEERISNRMRLNVQGSWFEDTIRRSESSIESTRDDWENDPDDARNSYLGAEQR